MVANYHIPDNEGEDVAIKAKHGSPSNIRVDMKEAAVKAEADDEYVLVDGGMMMDDGGMMSDGDDSAIAALNDIASPAFLDTKPPTKGIPSHSLPPDNRPGITFTEMSEAPMPVTAYDAAHGPPRQPKRPVFLGSPPPPPRYAPEQVYSSSHDREYDDYGDCDYDHQYYYEDDPYYARPPVRPRPPPPPRYSPYPPPQPRPRPRPPPRPRPYYPLPRPERTRSYHYQEEHYEEEYEVEPRRVSYGIRRPEFYEAVENPPYHGHGRRISYH